VINVKIVELEFNKAGANIVTFTRDKLGRIKTQRFKHTHYIYEEDPNGSHRTLNGQKVSVKKFKKFWDVKQYIKTSEKPTYEDDLSYTKRWILDHGSQLESEGQPRVMFYDIETTGFSSTDDQIISIVAHDSYNDMYYDFIWSPDHECDSERKMLLEFAKVIKNVDPDILSGWNSDRFDLPFVVDRMDTLNVPTTLLSRLNQKVEPYHTNEGEVYRIRGRIVIDYLKAFKKQHYGEMDSYSLQAVAEHELGVGKIETECLPGQLWEEQRYDELLDYNRRDVEIMVQLDEKLRIIEFLDRVSDIASCDFHDTLYNSRIVDSYTLKYTSSKGIILPSRRFNNRRSGYTGAKVLEPVKGIHENVGIFDLASLYPSIIITWNLSPETVNTDRDDTWNQPKGLVPTLLEDLFTLRQEYRDQGRDNDQRVVKEIMNSFYGVMALPTFRLYEQKVASETTRHGRDIILETKKVVEDEGYEVIYGDTDSVFVAGIPNTSTATNLESIINTSYDKYANTCGLSTHRLKIEFEEFATRAIMVKKKRYAMKLADGRYKIAGFQLKRSDTQPLTKTVQETILHQILSGAGKKETRDFYHDIKAGVLRGDWNSDIGIPRKFTKRLDKYADGTAIRGALYSNKHFGTHIGAGDKCLIYHIKHVTGGEPTDAIAISGDSVFLEVPPNYIIDIRKHWERIDKALFPLLDDLGILEKQKQTGLDAFL
jgi:DNA polymerase elongation subunit (family B)